MLDYMYYDEFTNEYTLEREKNAPPERYLLTHRGLYSYKECWKTTSGILNIGYVQELLDKPTVGAAKAVNIIRQHHAKKNNCTLLSMLSWTIPAAKFDEYAKRFGLEEEK